MNTENKILAGIVIIFLVVCSSLIIISLLDKETEYKILIRDCNVYEGECGLNQTLDVNEMNIDNQTIYKEDLTKEYLDSNCISLKEKTWGCGKYLIEEVSF